MLKLGNTLVLTYLGLFLSFSPTSPLKNIIFKKYLQVPSIKNLTWFPKDHTQYPVGLCGPILCQQYILFLFKFILKKNNNSQCTSFLQYAQLLITIPRCS